MIYYWLDIIKILKDDKPTLCGYHYYMQPETAMLGIENLLKLKDFVNDPIATDQDYDDVSYI